MIKVQFGKREIEATFTNGRWHSDDKDAQKMLSSTFDWDSIPASAPFQVSVMNKDIHGLDAIAYDAIQHLNPVLISYEPDPIPDEEAEEMVV